MSKGNRNQPSNRERFRPPPETEPVVSGPLDASPMEPVSGPLDAPAMEQENTEVPASFSALVGAGEESFDLAVEVDPIRPWPPETGDVVLYRLNLERNLPGIVVTAHADHSVDLVIFHAPGYSAHGGPPQASTFKGNVPAGDAVGCWMPRG